MIVKLTYSAELEEVPGEVSKIVSSVNGELENLVNDLSIVSANLENIDPDVKTALSKIDFSLRFIEKLDTKLKDCQSILSGYLGVLEQQAQKSQPPPPQVVEDTEAKSRKTTKKE